MTKEKLIKICEQQGGCILFTNATVEEARQVLRQFVKEIEEIELPSEQLSSGLMTKEFNIKSNVFRIITNGELGMFACCVLRDGKTLKTL